MKLPEGRALWSQRRATAVGFVAVLLWALLALFTAATGQVPPLQLAAMTFAMAFMLALGKWLLRGENIIDHLRQPPIVWAVGVGGLFGYHFFYFVALAVLMPIVASMGGNAGTQTLTVAVRALATHELTGANALRIVGKELVVGALNGILFAILVGLVAAFWFATPTLGVVIAVAMIINMVVAALAGTLIPLGLNRAGIDPAIAATVFLTTITDVVGFFVFLGLAALFLL